MYINTYERICYLRCMRGWACQNYCCWNKQRSNFVIFVVPQRYPTTWPILDPCSTNYIYIYSFCCFLHISIYIYACSFPYQYHNINGIMYIYICRYIYIIYIHMYNFDPPSYPLLPTSVEQRPFRWQSHHNIETMPLQRPRAAVVTRWSYNELWNMMKPGKLSPKIEIYDKLWWTMI